MSAAHTDIRPDTFNPRTGFHAIVAAVYAAFALIAAAGILMGAMGLSQQAEAGSASVDVRQVEKRPLAKEWVWEKQSPRFDHMWRVPR